MFWNYLYFPATMYSINMFVTLILTIYIIRHHVRKCIFESSKIKYFLKSKRFLRWCVIICKNCFLDFVHLYFNKMTAQPGGPTARVSVLPFYLKTEEDPASETI
jgi:hypothetical protein